VGHKHQVLTSLTRPLSKASLDAYRSYRIINMCCLLIFLYDILCTTCRVLFDDGDRLYGSTIPYTILDVDVLLL
jgi:hypothetical protein